MWLPRCPASYITAFTNEMLEAFLWLDVWGKTPIDLGGDIDDLDPRYFPAMRLLKQQFVRQERERIEKLRPKKK